MGTLGDKLDYLDGTKTAIKNAIVAKGVSVSENDTFRSYATKIGNIQTVEDLSTELNAQDTALASQETKIGQLQSALEGKIALDLQAATSDANATANDIALNKTAYVNGVKLTGTLDNSKIVIPNGMKLAYSTYVPDNIDTSNVKDFSQFLYESNVSQFNTSASPTNTRGMFIRCTSLVTVGQINTSKSTNFNAMFYGCTSLTTVPVLNMSSLVTAANQDYDKDIFTNCSSLSNESLNNILASCMTATRVYYGHKTLKKIGLSSAQATTCQSLSNWDDFVAAGWTSGY